MFVYQGRHEACIEYANWHNDVTSAFLMHGYYDPLTNHTPPTDQQVDA